MVCEGVDDEAMVTRCLTRAGQYVQASQSLSSLCLLTVVLCRGDQTACLGRVRRREEWEAVERFARRE